MDYDHLPGEIEENNHHDVSSEDIDEDNIEDEIEYTVDASDLAVAMDEANANGEDENTTLRNILNGETMIVPSYWIPSPITDCCDLFCMSLKAMAELHNLNTRQDRQNTLRPAQTAQNTTSSRTTIPGLTIQDLQRIFEYASSGVSVNVNQDEGEDEEEEEEEEEDYEDYYGSNGGDWDRSTNWFDEVKKPKEEGMSLLMSGEYGRLKHQLDSRTKKTNLARTLLNRGERTRPIYREDMASVCTMDSVLSLLLP